MHIYYFFYLLIEQIKIVINNFQIKPIFQTNFLAKGEKMQESSIIGKSIEEIDTPALLIDLDIMEKNIHTMAEFYAEKKGAALRPHQKGHRLPLVAKTQMDTGACGVSITTLGLAEYYVTCGIDSILLTNEIAGKNNPTEQEAGTLTPLRPQHRTHYHVVLLLLYAGQPRAERPRACQRVLFHA